MTRFEFLKKYWVMSLIGLVILLVAAGGVIYAVMTRAGDEGFLKGRDGKPLIWAQSDIPLTCMYDESVQDHQYEMDLARDQIDDKVGNIIGICDPWMVKDPFPSKPVRGAILMKVANPEEERDGVYVSSPWEAQHGGTTHLFTDQETGKLYGAIIYVNPNISKELRERVWLHELLHAFGLGHDRLQDSVMYPVATGRPKEMSKKDIKRLKEAYIQ